MVLSRKIITGGVLNLEDISRTNSDSHLTLAFAQQVKTSHLFERSMTPQGNVCLHIFARQN